MCHLRMWCHVIRPRDLWNKDNVELGNRSDASHTIAGGVRREKEMSSQKPSDPSVKSSRTSLSGRKSNVPPGDNYDDIHLDFRR